MARTWTEEQREAARQRAKAQGFGRAAVAEHGARTAAVFIAEQQDRVETTVEQAKGDDGSPVTTTHIRPGTYIMYKPLPYGRYEPRTVSVSAIGMLLRDGWSENCPDCGKKHIDKDGVESPDPNLCTAHPPVAVIICPVCRLRIYDNVHFDEGLDGEADENVINPDDLKDRTPEQRLIAARNLHLWMHHPRVAQERNIPPLPTALRDMVGETR